MLASSELPLALRVRTTASAPGTTRSARRRSSSLASRSSSAPWSASTYSRRCTDRCRSRRAWRSTTSMPKARMPPPNSSTKPNTIQRECCSSVSVRRSRWRRRAASWIRRRSISVLRVRVSATLAAFGPVRSTWPTAIRACACHSPGGGRERADLLEGRAVALRGLDGPVVRALELVQPEVVGLEEVADAGQRVAAQPGLLIEHGGQQVVRRAQLALRAEDRLALLARDQPHAHADHQDQESQQDPQSRVDRHLPHGSSRPLTRRLERG